MRLFAAIGSLLEKGYTVFVSMIAIVMSIFVKRDENKIAIGAWCGENYNDNSKYFSEYVDKHYPDKQIFWVGNDKVRSMLPENYIFLKINSLKSIIPLLKCKYFFFVQMHRADICQYNVYRNAVLCLIDHGIPVKKWARDDINYHGEMEFETQPVLKKAYLRLIGEYRNYNYITVSSDNGVSQYRSALAYRIDSDTRIIKTGTPRNDYLLHITEAEKISVKKKIAEEFGFDANRLVISYLPTYRRKSQKVESFLDRDVNQMSILQDFLRKNNAVLLEKNHFVADQFAENHQNIQYSNIIKIDQPVDFQELLIATDIQIADYSGGYLDYILLDRPIVHYLYDYVEYRDHDSGLYYQVDEFAAGPVVTTFEGVVTELENIIAEKSDYKEKREAVRSLIMTYEDGNACKRICRAVFDS